MGLISTTLPNLIGGVSQQPYTIRMASQCEAMENCLPSVVEFLRRRPGTYHRAKLLNNTVTNAAAHVIDRDSMEQYVVVVTNGDLRIFDLKGNRQIVRFPDGPDYLTAKNPNTEMDFLTINDYTFLVNKTVTVKRNEATTPVRQPEVLVFIKQASYATDYHITLDDTTYSHTTYKDDNRSIDGKEYNVNNIGEGKMEDSAWKDANRYKLSSTVITADLAAKINASGDYVCQAVKSTLWIRRNDGATFKSQVSDSRSNSHVSITTNKVQRFSDLPVVAPNGYATEITGDQSSSFDNYYVKFETNDGVDFDTGVWVETVKPGITHSLDARTMPHALVREADGTFSFKTLEWTPRECGDLDSAPDPTFLGRKISDVFFYRNRLGFLSGENCILSEAGKFFNFFASTVTTIVDSDPIDVAASHYKAASLYHAVASAEGLLLFSDTTQFLLEHDETLSTKTVAVKPVTEFECAVRAKPIGSGKTVFFATDRGDWAGVREYFVEEDTSLTDATDLTSHVPHYIPGGIHTLVGSTNEDCLLALSDQDRQSIYLYKYFWNGREKLQSSWSKWTFSGEVLSAAFLNSTLMIIVQYADGVYLEVMHLEPGYAEDGETYEYSLDRKITEKAVVSVKFDPDSRQSTVTFPYPLSDKPSIISRHPEDNRVSKYSPGVVFHVTEWGSNTAKVNGDLRGTAFMAGITYASLYEFSKQVLREDSGSGKLAVTEGRLQLRNMTLTYGDTGYFTVEVTPEYRDTDRRVFSGRLLGHGANVLGEQAISSGTFRFPVLSQADAVTIKIVSDSPLPFHITSAGWEAYYHIRSRRV